MPPPLDDGSRSFPTEPGGSNDERCVKELVAELTELARLHHELLGAQRQLTGLLAQVASELAQSIRLDEQP